MQGKWMYAAVGMVIALGLAMPVRASQPSGQIRVMLDFADGEVHKGSVTLYYAGTPQNDHYRLLEGFGGGLVKREDAQSQTLANWLAESAEGRGIPRILDADGTAWFTGLEEGLYLLVQSEPSRGLDPVPPMLIPIPYEDQWELIALPQYGITLSQIPTTGQDHRITIATAAMVLSGMGLGGCFLYSRKKEKF